MDTPRRTRKDSRKEETRRALIETAEAMFGELGIDSVSLRQIGSAAGSSNANVVGYHFGTKDDLILAIVRHRLPWLDQRRGQLYNELIGKYPEPSLEELVFAMWYPLFEQVGDNGMHTFAGFLVEVMRTGRGEIRRSVSLEFPQTEKISTAIRRQFPENKGYLLDLRMGIATGIVTAQLRTIDRLKHDAGEFSKRAEALFMDGLRMATAALSAPFE